MVYVMCSGFLLTLDPSTMCPLTLEWTWHTLVLTLLKRDEFVLVKYQLGLSMPFVYNLLSMCDQDIVHAFIHSFVCYLS